MFKFKEYREKANLTQKSAAISLGVSVQSVSFWETGARTPSLDMVLKMSDLYGVTTDELLGRVPMEISIKKEPAPPKGDGVREIRIPLDTSADAGAEFEKRVQQLIDQELNRRGIG